MRFFQDNTLLSKSAVRRKRASGVLAILGLLLTPFACFWPEATLPFEGTIRSIVALAFRPWSVRDVVFAGERSVGSPEPDDQERALVDAFRQTLDQRALAGLELVTPYLCTVRRTEGGRRRPTTLVLDARASREELQRLAGTPVVHGEDLVGFVIAPLADAPPQGAESAEEIESEDFVRVRTIDHVPSRRETLRGIVATRIVAVARSERAPDAPALRMLVEPAHVHDPFRLRVVRAAPQQLETWSEDVAPYVARTAKSDRLQPLLPAGLVLGTVEDVGYRERAFVLSRFVEPRFDARSLVRVGLLLPDPSAPPAIRVRSAPPRGVASTVWSSPVASRWRRVVLAARSARRGGAVIDGLRCLGRVDWAGFGFAGAVPLCEVAARIPLVLALGSRTQTVVARGAGIALAADGKQRGRFHIEHPATLDGAAWDGAWVFTGVDGEDFPHGLLCGRLRHGEGSKIDVELFGIAAWPHRVEFAIGGAR
ncbi:MAG: hypothetical protein H6832_08385 [Planctomycetes bacterium]|nr:hypothetical protein [Planctomycetota bacterium]MCB9918406.1 hypothetical protein [Planctomycetota bacterium]